jgi:hypothetical protein
VDERETLIVVIRVHLYISGTIQIKRDKNE